MGGLSTDPLIPVSLWLTLSTAAAVTMFFYARRRPSVMSVNRWRLSNLLMSFGLLAVLLLLLNPTWLSPIPPPPGKPLLTVLIDTSASMSTPDSEGGQTRLISAGRIAREMAGELGPSFDVQVKSFDDSLRKISLAALDGGANGSSTDVAGAVSSSLSGEHAAGEAIVLLSDGIHNAGGGSAHVLDAVRAARAMDSPIYTQTFGGEVKTVDLAVQIRSPQDLALVGQHLPLTVQVAYTGLTGGRANVALLLEGKEVARRTADLTASGTANVHFMLTHDKVGVYPYEARVDALPGEASASNNSAAYVLRVVDEPIRVLMLEGKPYWDSKFFTRTLTSDPAIALDSVVKLTDARLMRRILTHDKSSNKKESPSTQPAVRNESWQIDSIAGGYLADPDRLRGYQIIVLGRDVEPFLSEQAVKNLHEWVAQDGGSLVCYRGSPTAPANQLLAKLLPVRWTPAAGRETRFRLALTDRGQNLDWLGNAAESAGSGAALTGMPSLASSTVVDSSRPLAVVLAKSTGSDGTQSPAVTYQPYGAGRVTVIEGSGMWRWAFLSPAYQKQEDVYAALWHSLMRWLTSNASLQPGQRYSLRADKIRFGANEPASATLLAREVTGSAQLPAIELVAEGSATGTRTFTPSPAGDEVGVFRVNFGPLPDGRYRAKVAGTEDGNTSAQVVFDVRRYDQEQLDLQARPDLMARIAADSGGAVLSGDSAAQIEKLFKEHQLRSRPPQYVKTSAWDRWWILDAVLGIWLTSWFVRRSGGLV